MTREDLIEGLKTLNAPDQGMRYHGGGQVEGARYDSRTGEPLRPLYRHAELTVHGGRARFIYRLIENSEALAALLEAA